MADAKKIMKNCYVKIEKLDNYLPLQKFIPKLPNFGFSYNKTLSNNIQEVTETLIREISPKKESKTFIEKSPVMVIGKKPSKTKNKPNDYCEQVPELNIKSRPQRTKIKKEPTDDDIYVYYETPGKKTSNNLAKSLDFAPELPFTDFLEDEEIIIGGVEADLGKNIELHHTHNLANAPEYVCASCMSAFQSKQSLRKHIMEMECPVSAMVDTNEQGSQTSLSPTKPLYIQKLLSDECNSNSNILLDSLTCPICSLSTQNPAYNSVTFSDEVNLANHIVVVHRDYIIRNGPTIDSFNSKFEHPDYIKLNDKELYLPHKLSAKYVNLYNEKYDADNDFGQQHDTEASDKLTLLENTTLEASLLHEVSNNKHKPYICCGETYATKLSLIRHVNSIHLGSQQGFLAPIPNLSSDFAPNANSKGFMHEIMLGSERHNKKVNNQMLNPQVEHTSIHQHQNKSDMVPNKIGAFTSCPICGETFKNSTLLRIHLANVHSQSSIAESNLNFLDSNANLLSASIPPYDLIGSAANENLEEAFGSVDGIKEEKVYATDERKLAPYNKNHKFKSVNSNANFARFLQLRQNRKNQNIVYVCEHCSRTFLKRAHLNRHMASAVHSDVLLHRCGYCGMRFDSQLALREHLVDFFYHKDPEISRIPKYVCYLCTFPHILGIGTVDGALETLMGNSGLTLNQQLLLQPLIDPQYLQQYQTNTNANNNNSSNNIVGINNDEETLNVNDDVITSKAITSNASLDQSLNELNDIKPNLNDLNAAHIGSYLSQGIKTEDGIVQSDPNPRTAKRQRPPDLMLKLVTELLSMPETYFLKKIAISAAGFNTGIDNTDSNDAEDVNSEKADENDRFYSANNNLEGGASATKKYRVIKVTRFRSKEELLRHMYYIHPREYLLSKTTTANLQKWLDNLHSIDDMIADSPLQPLTRSQLDHETLLSINQLPHEGGSSTANLQIISTTVSSENIRNTANMSNEPPFFLLSHSLQISEEGRHSQMFLHEPRLGIIPHMVNVGFYDRLKYGNQGSFGGYSDAPGVKLETTTVSMEELQQSLLHQQQQQQIGPGTGIGQEDMMSRQLTAGSVLLGLNPSNAEPGAENAPHQSSHQREQRHTLNLYHNDPSTTLLHREKRRYHFNGNDIDAGSQRDLDFEDPCGNYQILRIGDMNSTSLSPSPSVGGFSSSGFHPNSSSLLSRVRRRTRHDLGDSEGHRCKICGKFLAYDRSLKQHIRAMHPHEWARIERDRIRRFNSGLAERRTRFDLRCEPGHLCEFCGKTLAYDRSLKQHIKNVHRTLVLASQGLDTLTNSQALLGSTGQELSFRNDKFGPTTVEENLMATNTLLQTADGSQIIPPGSLNLDMGSLGGQTGGNFVIVESGASHNSLTDEDRIQQLLNQHQMIQPKDQYGALIDSRDSAGNNVTTSNEQPLVKRRTRFDLAGSGFLCNFCGKTLAYDRSLKQHIKTMHREEWAKMAKRMKRYNTHGNSFRSLGNADIGDTVIGGTSRLAPPLIQSLLWGGPDDAGNSLLEGGGVDFNSSTASGGSGVGSLMYQPTDFLPHSGGVILNNDITTIVNTDDNNNNNLHLGHPGLPQGSYYVFDAQNFGSIDSSNLISSNNNNNNNLSFGEYQHQQISQQIRQTASTEENAGLTSGTQFEINGQKFQTLEEYIMQQQQDQGPEIVANDFSNSNTARNNSNDIAPNSKFNNVNLLAASAILQTSSHRDGHIDLA